MSPTAENPTASFYDRISTAYDALADSNEHVAREKGLHALDIQRGERVLEIGYGTGHSLVQLAEAVGPTGSVCGVDISTGMHDVAAKRVRTADLQDRVELKVATVPPLPYGDHTFDAVSMSMTLELFPEDVIPRVLAEVQRVLKPGGRLGVVAMATTHEGEADSLLERTYKWMHQHFPHIVDCQPIPLAQIVAQAGFRLTQQIDLKIWTMPVMAVVGIAPDAE